MPRMRGAKPLVKNQKTKKQNPTQNRTPLGPFGLGFWFFGFFVFYQWFCNPNPWRVWFFWFFTNVFLICVHAPVISVFLCVPVQCVWHVCVHLWMLCLCVCTRALMTHRCMLPGVSTQSSFWHLHRFLNGRQGIVMQLQPPWHESFLSYLVSFCTKNGPHLLSSICGWLSQAHEAVFLKSAKTQAPLLGV